MAEIHNISNNLNTIFSQQPNTVQNTQRQINQIDVRINSEENKIVKNRQLSEITKEMMVVNRVLYNSNNEIIKLYQESKELNEKRINLLLDTNNKLQTLLDRNSSKINGSDIKNLDNQLDTFTKKEKILKSQANVVDAKIEKLAVKVNFVEQQITMLEANSENIETSNVQVKLDKNSFATSYRPTAYQTAKLELSKIQQEPHNLDNSDTLFKQRVFYSQKNIYESILNSLLLKVVV